MDSSILLIRHVCVLPTLPWVLITVLIVTKAKIGRGVCLGTVRVSSSLWWEAMW